MDLMYCMYSVCNSANFAKFIAAQTLDNESLVFFDVVSLFTIVPTNPWTLPFKLPANVSKMTLP